MPILGVAVLFGRIRKPSLGGGASRSLVKVRGSGRMAPSPRPGEVAILDSSEAKRARAQARRRVNEKQHAALWCNDRELLYGARRAKR